MEREFELNTKHPACLIWAAELPMAFAKRVVLQVLASVKMGVRHQAASATLGPFRAKIASAGVRQSLIAAAGVRQAVRAAGVAQPRVDPDMIFFILHDF